MKRKLILVSALTLALTQTACASTPETAKETNVETTTETVEEKTEEETSWKEDYAHLVGQEAIIYGSPVAKYAQVLNSYNEKFKAEGQEGAANFYIHTRKLMGPEYTGGTSMNRDTLYSLAFLELTEPMVLTIGDNIDGRYYSIEITDFYSDCISYMGTRTTNNEAAAYLVVPMGWEGDVPEGIDQVVESPTNWILSVGRTFTTNTEEDLKIANQMQDDYKIYTLSSWEAGTPEAPAVSGDIPDMYDTTDPLSYLDYVNTWMRMVGFDEERDHALMKEYALVGMGSYSEGSVKDLDEETQKGLIKAYEDGMALLDKTSKELGSILDLNKTVNGWIYNPQNWGRMAETGDFLGRAATQSYSGGTENLVEEAVKLRTFKDNNGNQLNGSNEYMIHFEADQIPQVDAFWSITAYDSSYNIRENEAKKYEIRDIDPDLKYNDDGSLTIYLQSTKPEEKNANWLPVAPGEDFNLFFRAYLPGEDFINQEYIPPAVTIIE